MGAFAGHRYELIVGARDKRELVTIDGFLSLYPVVSLSESIGAGAYRLLKEYTKSHGLHVFDSLVAATAIEKALTLVTLSSAWPPETPAATLAAPAHTSRLKVATLPYWPYTCRLAASASSAI